MMVIGLILIAVGIIALLSRLGILSESIWSYTWPSILIILGLSMLYRRRLIRKWWCGWMPGDRKRDYPKRED
jgi:hypothetical protein